MARSVAFLPLMLALAACNTTSEPETAAPQPIATQRIEPGVAPKPAVLAAIKAAAAKSLKDPYSAQWERLLQGTRPNVRGEPTDVVCGYVNAKNSYGAYAGAKPFVYFVADQSLYYDRGRGEDAITLPAMLKTFCIGLL